HLPVPVIVIGNITVGGTGKTPLILWLVTFFMNRGILVGVISRGYGRRTHGVVLVKPEMSFRDCGDEPWLIYQKTGCPVAVGEDRVAAAKVLLHAYPHVQIILSDDGMQHYRLFRDIEVLVVDGKRRFGNNLLLPAGPLRELSSRVTSVDAVVVNGRQAYILHDKTYCMQLVGDMFYNLAQPSQYCGVEQFKGKTIHAVAGIGNPQRFFDALMEKGLNIIPHIYPDHYEYQSEDLGQLEGEILMTEKDAVKCQHFAQDRFWVFPVRVSIDEEFGLFILEKTRTLYGSKAD
ncbi:MAG: tetraacyldisaccharide 4'-kinase, partial [Pseudomonadota bacterium]|nr:tetraacyldisaccharide 4'-kinase [Pseudomonadota bacterium]